MPRVAYSDREFQTRIISEMVELLGDAGERGDLTPMSIQKAAKTVSGESDPNGPRRSADSLRRINYEDTYNQKITNGTADEPFLALISGNDK
jgi:hypothetical protein